MGEIDSLIERGMRNAIPESEAFCEHLYRYISERDLITARGTIYNALLTHVGSGFVVSAYQEPLLAELYGMLEVASNTTELTAWTSLPFKEAIAFFKSKRIVSPSAFKKLSDVRKRAAFAIAGLKDRYAVQGVFGLLTKAINEGTTKRTFLDSLKDQFGKLGLVGDAHHIDTVFRTNVLGAYQQGRHKQMTNRTVLKKRPYWRYRTVGDSRVRDSHRAQNGKVYPANHAFWSTWYPPNGFSCRCGVLTLSKDEAKDYTISTEMPTEKPDKGFTGSPKTQKEVDKTLKKVNLEIDKSKTLKGPKTNKANRLSLADKVEPVHTEIGDLDRSKDNDRNATVDRFADSKNLDSILKTISSYGLASVYDVKYKPAKNVAIEVALYSQNKDSVEQLINRLADKPELVANTEIKFRASYQIVDTELEPRLERSFDFSVLQIATPKALARSTETVICFKPKTDVELLSILDIAMDTEAGTGSAIRNAMDTADVRVRGISPGSELEGFKRVYQNWNKRNCIVSDKPIDGYKHEEIFINESFKVG